ncbi:MAG: hypothetical protein WC637_14105 [Victivallales bacterium]|jgi:hypothetical protein
MKKFLTGMMVVALGICFCVGTFAGDKPKGDGAKKGEPVAKGKVEVVKTGDVLTSITIVGKDKKSEVVLDENGKKLADMNGKYVMVRGTEASGKVTVTEFKEIEKGKKDDAEKDAKKAGKKEGGVKE